MNIYVIATTISLLVTIVGLCMQNDAYIVIGYILFFGNLILWKLDEKQ